MNSYLVLLRVGFTLPFSVARNAVRSYRTLSPLPQKKLRRSPLCRTGRRLSPPRRYLALCSMEPGLSSVQTFHSLQSDCPVDLPLYFTLYLSSKAR